MEAAGDHEVKDEPEVVVEAESDAFADTAQLADGMTFDAGQRGLDRPQKKRARDTDFGQRLADDAGSQRAEIGFDVGEFRHGYQIARDRAELQERQDEQDAPRGLWERQTQLSKNKAPSAC